MEQVENDQKHHFFCTCAANPGFIEIPNCSNGNMLVEEQPEPVSEPSSVDTEIL